MGPWSSLVWVGPGTASKTSHLLWNLSTHDPCREDSGKELREVVYTRKGQGSFQEGLKSLLQMPRERWPKSISALGVLSGQHQAKGPSHGAVSQNQEAGPHPSWWVHRASGSARFSVALSHRCLPLHLFPFSRGNLLFNFYCNTCPIWKLGDSDE